VREKEAACEKRRQRTRGGRRRRGRGERREKRKTRGEGFLGGTILLVRERKGRGDVWWIPHAISAKTTSKTTINCCRGNLNSFER
jgi:hypothetical protein